MSVGPDGDGHRITVADNGPGIAPEIRDQLFSPFQSDKGHRGTGLGLAVVAKIAAEHGGDVAADDRDGGGAVFTLRLPAADAEVRPVDAPEFRRPSLEDFDGQRDTDAVSPN